MEKSIMPHPRNLGPALRTRAFFDFVVFDKKADSVYEQIAAAMTKSLFTLVSWKIARVDVL